MALALTDNLRGIILMSSASIVFSLKDGFAKFLGDTYPVTEILWIQYSSMLIIFLPIVVMKYGWRNLRPASPSAQFWRGVFSITAVGLFYLALTDIPLADATALIFITPIIVTILSPFILKERVGIRRWIAVLIGFGGVLLIVQPGFQEVGLGTFAGLGAGFVFALFSLSSRAVAQQGSPLLAVIYTALVGFIGMGVFLPSQFILPTQFDAGLFLGLVAFAAAGQALLMYAFAAAPAVVVTPFFYMTILVATTVGYFVFGDFPNLLSWAGIAILIAVGVYIALREAKAKETVE